MLLKTEGVKSQFPWGVGVAITGNLLYSKNYESKYYDICRNAEQILVIADGQIVQKGIHNELMFHQDFVEKFL